MTSPTTYGFLFVLNKRREMTPKYRPITAPKGLTFGRAKSCSVRIGNDALADEHAHLVGDVSGKLFLKNLKSNSCGFLVNNEYHKDREPVEIVHLDTLTIGKAHFQFYKDLPLSYLSAAIGTGQKGNEAAQVNTGSARHSPLADANRIEVGEEIKKKDENDEEGEKELINKGRELREVETKSGAMEDKGATVDVVEKEANVVENSGGSLAGKKDNKDMAVSDHDDAGPLRGANEAPERSSATARDPDSPPCPSQEPRLSQALDDNRRRTEQETERLSDVEEEVQREKEREAEEARHAQRETNGLVGRLESDEESLSEESYRREIAPPSAETPTKAMPLNGSIGNLFARTPSPKKAKGMRRSVVSERRVMHEEVKEGKEEEREEEVQKKVVEETEDAAGREEEKKEESEGPEGPLEMEGYKEGEMEGVEHKEGRLAEVGKADLERNEAGDDRRFFSGPADEEEVEANKEDVEYEKASEEDVASADEAQVKVQDEGAVPQIEVIEISFGGDMLAEEVPIGRKSKKGSWARKMPIGPMEVSTDQAVEPHTIAAKKAVKVIEEKAKVEEVDIKRGKKRRRKEGEEEQKEDSDRTRKRRNLEVIEELIGAVPIHLQRCLDIGHSRFVNLSLSTKGERRAKKDGNLRLLRYGQRGTKRGREVCETRKDTKRIRFDVRVSEMPTDESTTNGDGDEKEQDAPVTARSRSVVIKRRPNSRKGISVKTEDGWAADKTKSAKSRNMQYKPEEKAPRHLLRSEFTFNVPLRKLEGVKW